MRSPKPRPTAVAALVAELADGRAAEPSGAARRRLVAPGRSLPRQAGRAAGRRHDPRRLSAGRLRRPLRPILVSGANGTLGRAFATICARAQPRLSSPRPRSAWTSPIPARSPQRSHAGGRGRSSTRAATSASTRPSPTSERCMRENARRSGGPGRGLRRGADPSRSPSRAIRCSTDAANAPWVESDAPAPLNVYGAQQGRRRARRAWRAAPRRMVVRTSAFFGPWDRHNFVFAALRARSRAARLFRAADRRPNLADLRAGPRQRLPRSADRRRNRPLAPRQRRRRQLGRARGPSGDAEPALRRVDAAALPERGARRTSRRDRAMVSLPASAPR